MATILYVILGSTSGLMLLAGESSRSMLFAATGIATLVSIACVLDICEANRRWFGLSISTPLGAFFIVFLMQFNIVRGWIYSLLHDDYLLLRLGGSDPDGLMTRAMCFIALFVSCFGLAYRYAPLPNWLLRTADAAIIFKATDPDTIAKNRSSVLLFSFVATLVCLCFMIAFSALAGGTDLATRISTAYVYMLPLISYSVCLALYGGVLATARDGKLMWVVVLLAMFLVISYFGRTISTFRIYGITLPVLIVGYHLAQRSRLLFCVIGMLMVFPLITHLGRNRTVANEELASAITSTLSSETEGGLVNFLMAPYLATGGDFTTVDIFASALKEKPQFHPWGLSWIYALVHFIPRQIWPSKPEGGILYDTSFSQVNQGGNVVSVPYTPGVVGDAYLEGDWPFVLLIGLMFGSAFRALDLLLGRRKMLFGPTIDYRTMYAAFLFVAFFANRSLPYFIVLFCAINVVGIIMGRYIIRMAIGLGGGSIRQRKAQRELKTIFPLPRKMSLRG